MAIKTFTASLLMNNVTCHFKKDGETITLNYGESKEIPVGNYNVEIVVNNGFKIVSITATHEEIGPWPSEEMYFSISDDGKKATGNSDFNEGDTLTIRGVTEVVEGVPSVVGTFNHLYLIDSTNLRKLTNHITVMEAKEERDTIQQYMINVLRFPFNINETHIIGNNGVILGAKIFDKLEVLEIDIDQLTIDMGKIEIPLKYNNTFDYLNTSCILHLPYSENIELEPSYIIGETISIEYIVSLYDGEGTINISSSKIDDVFLSQPIKIGTVIPYFNHNQKGYTQSQQTLLGVYNKLKQAYVEVIRNLPYENDSPFNDGVVTQSKLKNEKGYVKVNNIILENKATSQERNEIIRMLESGVFIK